MWWINGLMLAGLCLLFYQKDVQIQFDLVQTGMDQAKAMVAQQHQLGFQPTIMLTAKERKVAGRFRNISFVLGSDWWKKAGLSDRIARYKKEQVKAYVERFAPIALQEQKLFGVPASIKLAQGLLETDAGGSSLATQSHNHFGIKCKSTCRNCQCRNIPDDDPYDMFRVYQSAWESYRHHSRFLQHKRYKHLFRLDRGDYKAWAKGLQEAGYATDTRYAAKLIALIEALDLHQLDRPGA